MVGMKAVVKKNKDRNTIMNNQYNKLRKKREIRDYF